MLSNNNPFAAAMMGNMMAHKAPLKMPTHPQPMTSVTTPPMRPQPVIGSARSPVTQMASGIGSLADAMNMDKGTFTRNDLSDLLGGGQSDIPHGVPYGFDGKPYVPPDPETQRWMDTMKAAYSDPAASHYADKFGLPHLATSGFGR